jgi:hypothetical protein
LYFGFFTQHQKKSQAPTLNPEYSGFFFAGLMLCGTIQLNVAYYGYILFFHSSKDIIENNYLIRWIAFLSAILQTFCTPSKENQGR